MLFYVVPKGKMILVGCYILGLGEIWSAASDSCFFLGGQKYNMKTGHMMQQAELSYIMLSVALVFDSSD